MGYTVDIISRRRLLAQLRPSGTSAVSFYKPSKGIRASVDLLIVANVSGSSRTFSIYLDADGSTYDDDSALYKTVTIAANTTAQFSFDGPLNGLALDGELGGSLGVQSSAANDLNFTAFGSEVAR